ncbi:F0F1 ATP synthase subunit delta [Kocuria palustris]|uniref:F0F1 ATP synthase subunit delta n=1 Tax=Kocuria palustris TaxID=71999 RepID=UPI0011A71948|nr:F0F1 ATP synthase subunit delta [Kocuria palustris]
MSAARSGLGRADAASLLRPWAQQAHSTQARELFDALEAVQGNDLLRRSLTDPSRSGEERGALARRIFGSAFGDAATGILEMLSARTWATEDAFVEGLESAAVVHAGLAAERRLGAEGLDGVVDDALGTQALLEEDPQLQQALTDARAPREARLRLLDRVAPSLGEEGRLLAEQAVLTPREHRPHRVLADWAQLLSEVREGGIARVRYAGALDDAQVERLRGALSRLYGRDLKIVLDEDRTLVGGLRITVGDEVIDGSVAGRLDELQSRMRA